jgi:glycosyltransferase involved in cell wall biosynthesis
VENFFIDGFVGVYMTGPTINVIEPTLQDEAGHCLSFVKSLCQANAGSDRRIVLWTGKSVEPNVLKYANVRIVPFFYRRIRRIQSFFLYRKLLEESGRIFVATASRMDALLLKLAAGGNIPCSKVFLYFHWVNRSDRKRKFFAKLASRQPEIVILGPTPSIVQFFRECGFPNVNLAAYPITAGTGFEQPGQTSFSHLLFAGAARQDKGFHNVVRLLEVLAEQRNYIPAWIQTSSDHYDKYDAATRESIKRVSQLCYPSLKLYPQTLSTTEFSDLFSGAICLQPYIREEFSDRISGITLDALSRGCPIITTAGTWTARVVERFDAGVTIDEGTPERMLSAVYSIRDSYLRFHENASKAWLTLKYEHDAAHLLNVLVS